MGNNQTYFDLIQKQGETIAELVNKTAEQENMINLLITEQFGMKM